MDVTNLVKIRIQLTNLFECECCFNDLKSSKQQFYCT